MKSGIVPLTLFGVISPSAIYYHYPTTDVINSCNNLTAFAGGNIRSKEKKEMNILFFFDSCICKTKEQPFHDDAIKLKRAQTVS